MPIFFYTVVTANSLTLIELNPFHRTTDSCLFDWSDEKDLRVLLEGPFELRCRSTPAPLALARGHVGLSWQRVIEYWKKEHFNRVNRSTVSLFSG